MNEIFDVVIIGGGPAGSAAGTLLAKAGRSVLILEKEKFPRFHIGESMAHGFSFKWRLWFFGALVKLQKRFSVIAPRLTLRPTVT
jgi:flavin-dependent dehydrogenase